MKIAYFDNAATTFPKPEEVYNFTEEFNRNYGVNVGRGQYSLSSKAQYLLDDTRKILLELLGAENKSVIFTPSATIALNTIIRGLELKKGANVYITPFEHNSVLRVLNYLKKTNCINVKLLAIDIKTGNYKLDEIRNDFEENKPDLVIMSHASNVCGLIAPVEKIFKLSKEYNSLTLIDMSQTAGLLELELNSDIYDFIVFAGHKTLYSYIGTGGFIMKNNLGLAPLIYGGSGLDSANEYMPKSSPERYEAGSVNIQSISSLNASIRWIKKIGIDKIFQKEIANREKLINILKDYYDFEFIGNYEEKTVGIVSVNHKNLSPDNIGSILSKRDIAVRTGLHCAPIAHKTLNTFPEGTIRFSTNYFNEEIDFNMLKEALDYIYINS